MKAFHIIFMVSWFAGLFYLPRLFVYHSITEDKAGLERFIVMERRLYWGIMTPAALITIFTGVWMLYDYAWILFRNQAWLHLKLLAVAGVIIYHFFCLYWLRGFRNNTNSRSQRFYRIVNELPLFFLITIVILVILKPSF